MEQWKIPEIRRSATGYTLNVPGDDPFQSRSGLSPTPAPSPAPSSTKPNSARNGNGVSTHTDNMPRPTKHWCYYTLDRVKKRFKDTEAILKERLEILQIEKSVYLSDIRRLKESHEYLKGLKDLGAKVKDYKEQKKRILAEVEDWWKLVDSLQAEIPEPEADSESESSGSLESNAENESEAEDEDNSGDEAADEMEEESASEEDSESGSSDDEDGY
ncbi:hypothetical protein B0T20DRAFT_397550 [Sordaria brevicollis]|uniref:Uncharacterized protein n=1 Tax=Sordaria brevicollis TaxID=83679 RepID=A0AAE0NVL6_SORBR|nr:hypothetical protein B0T20DRAFT_397550 [Sordaria brevicollis]